LQIGLPNFDGILFFSLGANMRPKRSAFIIYLGHVQKVFAISASAPSVNPLGLISTLAPIGMLDLG
jgi:hypothetical protein